MIISRPASPEDLERIWAHDLKQNPGWPVEWRDASIHQNNAGMCKTFGIFKGKKAIGTGTLLFSPECKTIDGRTEIADGTTIANISALRIDKKYEGQGHISSMMKLMEQYARDAGYTTLTIGVEPKEARNLGIYLHWGYTEFIMHAMERDFDYEEPFLILYYAKQLN